MIRKNKPLTLTSIVLLITFGSILLYRFGTFSRYSPDIESVLQQSGSNRKELQKVLKHYGKNPSDSLKLHAAEFLIKNMADKYSEYYEAPWNDVATMLLCQPVSPDNPMQGVLQLGEPVKKEDVSHITGEYLISNIELSFKVWHEQTWGKTIPFDVFCEEIFPYRSGCEPLENWREKALASFADIYHSSLNDASITAVEACCKVNDLLPRFRNNNGFPHLNYSQLMSTTRGLSAHQSALAVFVMRALGIPVTCDFTPLSFQDGEGYSWNSVCDSNGRHHSFMGCESNPGNSHLERAVHNAKTYRHINACQQNVLLDAAHIPPLLSDINYILDVTAEYASCYDIRFPLRDYPFSRTGYMFLAIPGEMEWHPVAWGIVDGDSMLFQSVRDGVYLPVYYYDGFQSPAGNPFKTENSECHILSPDSPVAITLTNIAPINDEMLERMKGGRFEVSNRSDFSDARTIHAIDAVPGSHYQTIPVKPMSKYRYVRYVTPENEHCTVSVLEFYDEKDELLQGTVLGTRVYTSNTGDKAFDGDEETYFSAFSNPAWTGLDFGEPRYIAKIRYLPRTDGNSIYEGHVYELFYWNGSEWQSLGKKTADSHLLAYKAPANALYFLKNVTNNRIFRSPFVIEDNVQRWFCYD